MICFIDLVINQTPKTPIKSALQGGDIDSEVFDTLPYEIQLEVLNSVKKDMRYQVRKEAKELYKASPVSLLKIHRNFNISLFPNKFQSSTTEISRNFPILIAN